MSFDRIVISSGHGLHVRGASGILDEVNEARAVVDRVVELLESRGVDVKKFHDAVSTSQNENLNRIVNYHNAQTRDLDVSVHFNAFEQTDAPRGTEVFYVTQSGLAGLVSAAIASNGFIDRGAKKNGDLFFLNSTEMPAILIEVCFVDSEADAEIYIDQFNGVCLAIADALSDEDGTGLPIPPPEDVLFRATGKCSHFGGPADTGVSPSEGLAFIYDMMDVPQLFLPYQPEGTTGLARRLNPYVHYIAVRWDYSKTSKEYLANSGDRALVKARSTGRELLAFPADWGPNENTGRIADLSPGLLADLGISTDDEVEVIFPWKG